MERDSEKERDSEGEIVRGRDREKREGELGKKDTKKYCKGLT